MNQGGGTITLPDSSASNELQNLRLSNDTLFISSGNSVKLGSITSSSAPGSSTRIGFSSSATWTCPAGVTKITVELWGGGGGGGGGSGAGGPNFQPKYGCDMGSGFLGGHGGPGGKGGYNRGIINVTPGVTYSITIGQAGVGGIGGLASGANGTDGGNSSFSTLLTAPGGSKGRGAQSTTTGLCPDGTWGTDGSVNNFSTSTKQPIQGLSSTRTYVPVGYVQDFVASSCCAAGGSYGYKAACNSCTTYISGQNGGNGEAGYCVIIY